MFRLVLETDTCAQHTEVLNSALNEYAACFKIVPTLHSIVDERFYPGVFNKPEDGSEEVGCSSSLIVSEYIIGANGVGRTELYLLRTQTNEEGQAIPVKLKLNLTGDIGQDNYAIRERHFEDMSCQRVSLASGICAQSRIFSHEGELIGVYARETRNCDELTYSDKPNLQEEATSILTAFNTAYLAVTSNVAEVESVEKT